MKTSTKITIIFIILSAILIAGCYGPLNPAGPGDGTGGIVLPKDTASDTARSYSGEFAFETLLPVDLRVTVEHYEETIGPKGGTAVLEPGAVRVYISLTDESGSTVFQGMTGASGEINRTVYLPAAEEDMTLTLEAEGFETRRVVIQDMVRYEKIDRVMAMAGTGGIISAKGMEPDSDGDGVPDAYDIDPYDASAAFEIGVPADGNLTIAFEDLYGRANAGDADYNDFVAEYSIVETLDGDSRLKKIRVDVTGIEKIAGYEHTFGIRINAFGADNTADVEGEYIDANGNTVPFTMTDRKSPINIELFKRTSKAEKKSAYFVLTLKNSENIDELAEDEDVIVDRPPYNPYLYVKNTGKDVHLIGEESLDGSYDPLMFMDENNFPWALLVPDTWQPPTEAHRIEEFYPRFTRWRESGGELSPDWYHHDTPWEPVTNILVFSSDRDGDRELYSLNLDTDEVTQLTDNNATDKHPALSADRSKIAFVSNRSGDWGIYTVDVDGTGISEQLVTLTNSIWGNPSWSPDGAKITYDDNYDIHIMNSDGSGKEKFTDTQFEVEYYPAWSPDGTKIAYASNVDGNLNIYVKDVAGIGSATKITNLDQIDWQPSWSPDGTQIAFSAQKDSKYEIYIINSDGTGIPRNITNSADNESSPSWSSHGIAYVKNGTDILSIDPESGNPPEDRVVTSGNNKGPSW